MDNDALIECIRRGDREVIRDLNRELLPKCTKYLVDRGGTREEAKDFYQEVWLALFWKLKNHKEPLKINSIKGYIFGAFRNQCKEKFKRDKREKIFLDLDDSDSILIEQMLEEEPLDFDLDGVNARLSRALDNLGKHCKEILIKFYVYKQPLKEIGDFFGFKYDYAKQRRRKCLQELEAKYMQLINE